MRKASLDRKTKETDIRVRLNLDGRGKSNISTGVRFFDHMLEQIARHGGLDLDLTARGDLDVDQHHTVEDVGIALGEAIKKALGSKRGILRAGYFLMPMDDCLAAAALDFSGRAYCVCSYKISAPHVGDFQTELMEDFFRAFANALKIDSTWWCDDRPYINFRCTLAAAACANARKKSSISSVWKSPTRAAEIL